jgi:hypothetical protein
MPRAFNWLPCVYISSTVSLVRTRVAYHKHLLPESEQGKGGGRRESWRSDLNLLVLPTFSTTSSPILFSFWRRFIYPFFSFFFFFVSTSQSEVKKRSGVKIWMNNLQSEIDRQSLETFTDCRSDFAVCIFSSLFLFSIDPLVVWWSHDAVSRREDETTESRDWYTTKKNNVTKQTSHFGSADLLLCVGTFFLSSSSSFVTDCRFSPFSFGSARLETRSSVERWLEGPQQQQHCQVK